MVKAGKAPVARVVAWIEDPELGGKVERIAISTVKFTKLPALNFDHGNLVDEELPFSFVPSDLEYLDRIKEN